MLATRGRKNIFYRVQLKFSCEWLNCSYSTNQQEDLKLHQLEHFKNLKNDFVSGALSLTQYTCGICGVELDALDNNSVERHSHYHAWTICLRERGSYLQEVRQWPQCLGDPSTRNNVPHLPTQFECGWEYCDFKTDDVTIFILHVNQHPQEYSDSRYPSDAPLKCLWDNCPYIASRLKYLSCHMDTHTQEKQVACPTCGLLMVNFIKLEDHLKRQQVQLVERDQKTLPELHPSVVPHRCQRCNRLFPNERLLLGHLKRHINTIKCPYCDMTFWGKQALDRHIVFRHTSEKPFACPFCPYKGKMQDTLSQHISTQHKDHVDSQNRTHSGRLLAAHYTPSEASLSMSDHLGYIVSDVEGPLAAARALGNNSGFLHDDATDLSITHSVSMGRRGKPQWLQCSHPKCRFKSIKEKGMQIHYSRIHAEPLEKLAEADGQCDDYAAGNLAGRSRRRPIYACHLCPELKRRGNDLSKHLIEVHQLQRPPGHVRFTYCLEDDNKYRLQLTRLDTVEVATALLGEAVVSSLFQNNGGTTAANG